MVLINSYVNCVQRESATVEQALFRNLQVFNLDIFLNVLDIKCALHTFHFI